MPRRASSGAGYRPEPQTRTGFVEGPGADLEDEPRVLGQGDEVRGADQPPLRVPPTEQGFGPDHPVVDESHDGLVDQREFVPLDGVVQVPHHRDALAWRVFASRS